MGTTKDKNGNGVYNFEWAKRLEIEMLRKKSKDLDQINELLNENYQLLKEKYEKLKIENAVLSRNTKQKTSPGTHLNPNMKVVD